jgi:hypothetical protein
LRGWFRNIVYMSHPIYQKTKQNDHSQWKSG